MDARGNVVGIVAAKLNAAAALAASGALPENVNYAIKVGRRCCAASPSPRLTGRSALPFLESAPGVEDKLKKPNPADEKFEDVVKQTQDATVLVLVY